jgi:hypothetical protein
LLRLLLLLLLWGIWLLLLLWILDSVISLIWKKSKVE